MADNWIPDTRNRLAQRRAKKPDTKAGQLWALWPEIKAALEDGQSFKSIHQWLDEDAGTGPAISFIPDVHPVNPWVTIGEQPWAT